MGDEQENTAEHLNKKEKPQIEIPNAEEAAQQLREAIATLRGDSSGKRDRVWDLVPGRKTSGPKKPQE